MKFFLSKAFVLLIVFILVQVPVHWIENITHERMSYKEDATQSVSSSYAGIQYVSGPVLMIPYTHSYWEPVLNKDGNPIGREQRKQTGSISILPKTLTMDNDVMVEERKVGIFPVPVFKANIKIKANFSWNAQPLPVNLKSAEDTLEWGQAYLSLPIFDQHGIKNIAVMEWNDEKIQYMPGSQTHLYNEQGISAIVNAKVDGGNGTANIELSLIGTELLRNLPTADQTTVSFKSNWPNPQFTGTQLPDTRDVTANGFTASWQSTALATNIQSLWKACAGSMINEHTTQQECGTIQNESVGVTMIDPTNFYTKMTRALKYGVLFLAITFVAFVLFEVLCDLRIHPVQYTLLGIASGIFFLLLLSLAEQIGFAMAYGVAAGACLVLLTLYANALLKSWKRTLSFSAILATLYGVLFSILQQEDAALLTGSLLIFGLVAVTMMITRNIDWYAWQEKFSKADAVAN
jgi:inner membrane protein